MNEQRNRVRLSNLKDEHIRRFMQLSGDPELIDTMGWRPFGEGEGERFLRTANVLSLPYCGDGQPLIFSITTIKDKRPIGYVCLKGINEGNSSAELGIAIMEKGYRSQGYGTEALELALRYAFDKLGLSKVGLTVFPSNKRASRAYEKAGFEIKDILKNSWLMPDGRYVDMLLMEATRSQA